MKSESKQCVVPVGLVEEGILLPVMESPWPEYEPFALAPVSVSVRVSREANRLQLLYRVSAPELRRMCTAHNQDVHADSCVEVFLRNPRDEEYVNFEFSATGYIKVGRGESRANRILYAPETIDESIDYEVRILSNSLHDDTDGTGGCEWTARISIDLTVFGLMPPGHMDILPYLEANFQACGDGLERPYFLVWNPIDTPKPDFHRPEFFGRLVFSPTISS
ncbi:hypothetical protein Spico_0774 [Parasphaerochaeta coccoides DSM 17374]|uniref:Carbohydrate-binding domain-containing protein n=2 Tax=Parasphaerochaeta TaxID=3062336 RepID=F4GHA0_PARC1|nr:hypothetical protein Spico_0774 [Parasphaerochaeta coccoides DSM 17374]